MKTSCDIMKFTIPYNHRNMNEPWVKMLLSELYSLERVGKAKRFVQGSSKIRKVVFAMKHKKVMELLEDCGFKWENGFLLDEKGKEVCNFYPKVVTCFKNPLNGNHTYKICFCIGKEEIAVEKNLSLEELQKYNYLNVSNQCMLGINIPANQIRRILFYLIQKQILSLDPSSKVILSQLGWNICER